CPWEDGWMAAVVDSIDRDEAEQREERERDEASQDYDRGYDDGASGDPAAFEYGDYYLGYENGQLEMNPTPGKVSGTNCYTDGVRDGKAHDRRQHPQGVNSQYDDGYRTGRNGS